MRLDDGDDLLTLSDHLDQTSAATVSRMLREALEIRFDALEEFEDASRPDPKPWFIREQLEPVP
jgi:hypothetical protein